MFDKTQESTLLKKGPCPDCGSSDACASYDDGHTFCFSCEKHTPAEVSWVPKLKEHKAVNVGGAGLIPIYFDQLASRKITEQTCQKWGYGKGKMNGQPVQVATYCDNDGNPVAQKIRFKGKDFRIVGDPSAMALYGQHLWRDGGRMVVVTEGEIDALSVSQVYGNKYPVVSLPNGAPSAKKAILKSLDWLEKFDSVIFCFDNDQPGRKAAVECATALSPGKAKIAKLPLKDASEMLQQGRGKELIDLIWEAKTYRPDGIVSGDDVWNIITKVDKAQSFPYPWHGMNEMARGIRTGELVTFCAGSGVGKSAVCKEIVHHLVMEHKLKVGFIALEESVKRTALSLMGIQMNKPVHLDMSLASEDEMEDAYQTVIKDNLVFYDHFGSLDNDNLLNRIRYMVRSLGCRFIVLDHISLVVSGLDGGDERRNLDNAMTRLRSLVQETGVGMLVVSHLKRPDGNKGHEEGQRTTLAQLRGSAAIGQLSDMVFGLERDLQDPDSRDVTTVRCLKNRFTGMTGVACHVRYNRDSGRLSEAMDLFSDDDSSGGSF